MQKFYYFYNKHNAIIYKCDSYEVMIKHNLQDKAFNQWSVYNFRTLVCYNHGGSYGSRHAIWYWECQPACVHFNQNDPKLNDQLKCTEHLKLEAKPQLNAFPYKNCSANDVSSPQWNND